MAVRRRTRAFIDVRRQGETVVFAPTQLPDQPITLSKDTADEFRRLGFRELVYARGNGSGRMYATVEAWGPDEKATKTYALQVGQILARLAADRDGKPVPAKGFIANYRNGDPFDCRDENLEMVPAPGKRNNHRTEWTIRERRKLADRDLDPDAEFSKRRMVFRSGRRGKL